LTGLAKQYNELVRQINNTVSDASYKGVNFLVSATSSTVNFNEQAGTSLIMSGFSAHAGTGGLALSGGAATGSGTIATTNLDTSGELDGAETAINNALATLRTSSAELAANLTILSTRQSFITDMVNTLQDGAAKLTNADTNEEGANMLLLQTRQQLGVTSLSLASQAAQSVLRLF
jgi:flagellin-like hook-associated protein FlgL